MDEDGKWIVEKIEVANGRGFKVTAKKYIPNAKKRPTMVGYTTKANDFLVGQEVIVRFEAKDA